MTHLGKLLKTFLQAPINNISANAVNLCLSTMPKVPIANKIQVSNFSSLCARSLDTRTLLALPPPATNTQIAGFKVKYVVKRRCKDCYFVIRQSRMYVICPTHPRHKQMAPVKKPKYTWILTHATQSKVRAW